MADSPINFRKGSIEAGLKNGIKLLAGNPRGALIQAQTLLRSDPQNTAAHRLMARALSALGAEADARMARGRAVTLSRHVPVIMNAHKATLDGMPEAVEPMLRNHIARYPDDPVALLVNGEALARLGRVTDAISNFEAALAFMPEYREASIALVRAHHQRFDIPAALKALEGLLLARPGDEFILRWKASLLSNLGDNAASAAVLSDLTKKNPANAEMWVSLGDEYRTLGQSGQAHDAYRMATRANPALGAAWWSLAALRFTPFDESDRDVIRAGIAATNDPENRHYLHFALATSLDELGEHGEAFEHFVAGNNIRHSRDPFDTAIAEGEVARTREVLTAPFFAGRNGSGHPAADPVFIVSMPRAGSTLVEQVLASHPEIEGTAELPFIPLLIREMAADHGLDPDSSYRDLLPRVDATQFARIGEEYLRLSQAHRKTKRPFFIDKLPHNWTDVGFIKLILPNAKVIDVRRAPMDCCWSNFRLLFAKGHPSSNSLEGMAAYYRHYVDMMDHFDIALPGFVHRVIYERLVDDFEAEVRRMLEYLGLPFDQACLEFHSNRRAVATASVEQVRRPINRKGVGAWKAYEPWLGALRAAIGDLEHTYAGESRAG